MSNKRLLTYQDFLDKYGKRPPDIVFATTQKETREMTLEEAGVHLDKRHPYKEDMFPTSVKQAAILLRDKGLTEREITAISGCICRLGYNSALSNLEDLKGD